MPGPQRPTPPEEDLRAAIRRFREEETAQAAAMEAAAQHRRAKQQIVRQLYLDGWSYQRIADELGISRQRAYDLSARDD